MKKMSFAALMTSVLLVLTVVAAAYAASPDNNIILAAIDNAVTTLQNSIINSQNDINARTDALAPKSILINMSMNLDPFRQVEVPLLSVSEGKTYSGHITLVLSVWSNGTDVRLFAIMPITSLVQPAASLMSERQLNVDFSCIGLRMTLDNISQYVQHVEVNGVIQYTISTDVEFATVANP